MRSTRNRISWRSPLVPVGIKTVSKEKEIKIKRIKRIKKRRRRIEIEVSLENSRAVPIASVHRAAPSVGITHCELGILDTLLKVAATTPAG